MNNGKVRWKMSELVTKDDLRQFGLVLRTEIKNMIDTAITENKTDIDPEWLKSRAVRRLLDMSPGSLQNLRITGKVRHKKVLGSYYYNKKDIEELFNGE